jgi:hypothetical protein
VVTDGSAAQPVGRDAMFSKQRNKKATNQSAKINRRYKPKQHRTDRYGDSSNNRNFKGGNTTHTHITHIDRDTKLGEQLQEELTLHLSLIVYCKREIRQLRTWITVVRAFRYPFSYKKNNKNGR